jgi:hypothetical protein
LVAAVVEVVSLAEVVVLVVCKLELCYSPMEQHIQYQLVVEVEETLVDREAHSRQ